MGLALCSSPRGPPHTAQCQELVPHRPRGPGWSPVPGSCLGGGGVGAHLPVPSHTFPECPFLICDLECASTSCRPWPVWPPQFSQSAASEATAARVRRGGRPRAGDRGARVSSPLLSPLEGRRCWEGAGRGVPQGPPRTAPSGMTEDSPGCQARRGRAGPVCAPPLGRVHPPHCQSPPKGPAGRFARHTAHALPPLAPTRGLRGAAAWPATLPRPSGRG